MNRVVLVGLDVLSGALYTASTVVLLVHAFIPAPPLLRLADLAERAATGTHRALERAHDTRRHQ